MNDNWFPNVAAVMKERDALKALVKKAVALAHKSLDACPVDTTCNEPRHTEARKFLAAVKKASAAEAGGDQ